MLDVCLSSSINGTQSPRILAHALVVVEKSPLHSQPRQFGGSEFKCVVSSIKRSDNQSMLIKRWPLILVSLLLVAGVAYLIHLGSTERWPETDCTFAGSRVVKDVVPPVRSHVVVLYKGEYRLRYRVGGQDYYVWASSGWADPESNSSKQKWNPCPSTATSAFVTTPLVRLKPLSYPNSGGSIVGEKSQFHSEPLVKAFGSNLEPHWPPPCSAQPQYSAWSAPHTLDTYEQGQKDEVAERLQRALMRGCKCFLDAPWSVSQKSRTEHSSLG